MCITVYALPFNAVKARNDVMVTLIKMSLITTKITLL